MSETDVNNCATALVTIPTPKITSDLLARAFLDILARASGDDSKSMLRSGDPDDPIEKLLDDLSSGSSRDDQVSVRPDVAAIAILTARALETVPELIKELRRASPVVTIATHNPEYVALVAEVLEACAFGSDIRVQQNGQYEPSHHHRNALVISRDGTGSGHTSDRGNDTIAAALHAQSPIIGVATDPRRHLPRDLMRTSEHHLVLGDLDESAISLVIEAVTGSVPATDIDPELARAIDVSDLQLVIRKRQTGDECLRKLAEIVRNKDIFDDSIPKLEELAGYGQAKEWGLNLASDLAAYKRGRLDWSCVERGLLLAGSPGVGKTQYAKALARSAGVPIIATSVAQWNAADHLSGTLQAMRNAFIQARKLAPAILFIDELDGISDRSRLQGDYVEYWSQIVNLLLELLAGIDDREGVVVVGATNHPDMIDPAIKRAGRLDQTITIEPPDTDNLCRIFRFYLKDDLPDADLVPLALAARGRTGADVESWVRRARSTARRRDRVVKIDDIMHEIKGEQAKLPHDLRNIVAIHEAGHIVVGAALGCYEPDRAWITHNGGLTIGAINAENHLTLRGLESIITMLLGGRAAEKLMLGAEEVTIGSGLGDQSDLQRATDIAYDIETRFGFGECGLVRLPDSSRALMLHDRETVASIRNRLQRCHLKAETIIQLHCAAILEIATAIRDEGYVERSELLQIFKEHNLENRDP